MNQTPGINWKRIFLIGGVVAIGAILLVKLLASKNTANSGNSGANSNSPNGSTGGPEIFNVFPGPNPSGPGPATTPPVPSTPDIPPATAAGTPTVGVAPQQGASFPQREPIVPSNTQPSDATAASAVAASAPSGMPSPIGPLQPPATRRGGLHPMPPIRVA